MSIRRSVVLLGMVLAGVSGGEAQTRMSAAGVVAVQDLGAACDGVSDDSAAFQKALDAVAGAGGTLAFHGTCVVRRRLELTNRAHALRAFTVDGHGGTILTDGNDLFGFVAQAAQPQAVAITLAAMTLTNRRPGPPSGMAIRFDNSRVPAEVVHAPVIRDLNINNMAMAVGLYDVGDSRSENVVVNEYAKVNTAEAFHVEGTSGSRASANNDFRNVTVVGGTGWHLVGFVQGIGIVGSKVLEGHWGVKTDDPVNGEGVQINQSYFEASQGGIRFDRWSNLQFIGDTFDSSSWEPTAPGWSAISISPGGADDPSDFAGGVTIQGAQMNHVGGTSSDLIVAYLSTGDVSHNIIEGIAVRQPHCMRIHAPPSGTPSMVVVHDNSCWVAHGYDFNDTVIAYANWYTGDYRYVTLDATNWTCPARVEGVSGVKTCWNASVRGETDFINSPGLGPGGFSFYGADVHGIYDRASPLLQIGPDGSATVRGDLTAARLVSDPAGKAPPHSDSPCTPGQEAWDALFEYRCVAKDRWQRWARPKTGW